ncbi:hypothetical protein CHUAL_010964 [Chamberlinius hualienensis]
MLQLINRSYEARFLGCHALTSAVTSDVLSRVVRDLPSSENVGHSSKVNDCCTVLCCASGLIVTRRINTDSDDTVNGNDQPHAHPVCLKVTLDNILFCQVDKKRPEVTVWVFRLPKSKTEVKVETTDDDVTLYVYIYKCTNGIDALALFQTFSEMSRQVKLQRLNRRTLNVASTNWNSIADGIENNYQVKGVIQRRDREIREAMLEELRETLKSRGNNDVTDSDNNAVITLKKPLKDVSNMCNNRQRKPAKVISVTAEEKVDDEKTEPDLIITSPNVTRKMTSFQFPRSMGDIMKRLVNKNRKNSNNSNVIIKSSSLPNVHVLVTLPERKALRKIKKKSPSALILGDFEPEPVRIPNRFNNLTEPYFYVSPKKSNSENVATSGDVNSDGVAAVPPAWVHHKQVVHDIDNLNVTRHHTTSKRMSGGVKKKVHGQLPLRSNKSFGRKKFFDLSYAPKFASSPSIFNRSSSTTSNGSSSSSESGPESKLLRSVMKKPKQTDDNGNSMASNESKKNVTFHAYATVQVLP